MKIVHTADWHIGKVLHKEDLFEDLNLFFDWLIEYLQVQNIDLLLVAGDVFDLANPANRDIKLYFDVLNRLSKTNTQVIITGGNHDSVSLLDAPSILLDQLQIKVIGGARENIQDQVIPIILDNKTVCVILAVPFLRDRDLRRSQEAEHAGNRSKIISDAIKTHYDTLVQFSQDTYGDDIPIIGMGHLYMHGSITSPSERDIHIGNLEGLDITNLNSEISYMALGHIHKPQAVGKNKQVRYSGSPIYLDFSERDYPKGVVEIDIDNQKNIDIRVIPIPQSRDLKKIVGSYADVKEKILKYQNKYILPAFLDIEVREEMDKSQIYIDLEKLISSLTLTDVKILKHRVVSQQNSLREMDSGQEQIKTINELTPLEVFDYKLNEEVSDDSLKIDLKIAYNEIVQLVQI